LEILEKEGKGGYKVIVLDPHDLLNTDLRGLSGEYFDFIMLI
jgi:hypothetical protein